MIILTGANSDLARLDTGAVRDDIKFRFSSVIRKTIKKAEEFGYTAQVYDLGTLGMGKPFRVEDQTFVEKGHYEREVVKGYKSKSLFKPAMVKACLKEHQDLTVYMDGDAELRDCIDEIDSGDYDIGVTLRDKLELEGEWYEEHMDIVKYVNAGVIFFNATPATTRFLDEWEQLTEEVGNDQMALNRLTCPDDYPEIGSVEILNGVRVKYFSCLRYNYYYFDEKYPSGVKIMHFKGTVRHLYPFDWKTRLYCLFIVPLKNLARKVTKNR
jgi:hypothetical protein